MRHRHLDYPADTPVERLGAAAVDDLLDRGDLADWAPLARAVVADPHGALAERVLHLCAARDVWHKRPVDRLDHPAPRAASVRA